MGSFPYHSHIFRDSYGSGMGIVWEAYHKGVPLLGVPENPIDAPPSSHSRCHDDLTHRGLMTTSIVDALKEASLFFAR